MVLEYREAMAWLAVLEEVGCSHYKISFKPSKGIFCSEFLPLTKVACTAAAVRCHAAILMHHKNRSAPGVWGCSLAQLESESNQTSIQCGKCFLGIARGGGRGATKGSPSQGNSIAEPLHSNHSDSVTLFVTAQSLRGVQ